MIGGSTDSEAVPVILIEGLHLKARLRSRVYLVDDDVSVLKMLRHLVETIDVDVQAYTSPDEFLSAYKPGGEECLVTDLRMPGMSGMELQRRMCERNPHLPIIFISGHGDVPVAVEAMQRGAYDFLQKPFSMQTLLERIQSALARSREALNRQREQETRQARLTLLTGKEREIVTLVTDGLSSREIAEKLDISVRTVENHRARLMEKLHVSSVVELVKLTAGLEPQR